MLFEKSPEGVYNFFLKNKNKFILISHAICTIVEARILFIMFYDFKNQITKSYIVRCFTAS